nr:reverse transcriptase domain-containing protein [Tanacetum cinerariifolium]GEW10581.1 reverse transcriptase domain-containing protein [Tanacetum cinerariifolium]
MMTSNQFFGLEKDNPHDHIRWGSPSVAQKRTSRSILTWEDLVSKLINEFFPPSRTTNLLTKILNFQQRFDESFHEVWDQYKDLLRVCPHHGFTELHQIDTFYNALNPADQDSLNSAAGGNLLERHTQNVLTIIENKSKCLATGVNTFSELRDNIQGYVAAAAVNYNQELKAITTRSGIVLDGPSVPILIPFINPKEDERVEETLADQDLAEYTIKVPPPLLHINFTLADALILIPKYQKMLKALLSNKEKLLELANTPLNEDCSAVILKKLPEKLSDPGKFLIPCGFSELKCKALADLEMILRNGDERLTLNMRHDTSSYSNPPKKESINMVNIYDDSKGGNVLIEKFLDLDSTEDLHPPHNVNPLSGSTTSSSPNHLLEEFADELALITFPPRNDDLPFDIESDLKEIEYLLNHDLIKEIDSILKDSIDQSNLAELNDNHVDTMPEMFTDKHDLDYSSPPLYDEYDDDLFEVESVTEYVYHDPFDSQGEKIKESKLLIDELDLPSDFLPFSKYDSFLFKDFSKVDALPLTNNEDKDFDPPLNEPPFFKEVPSVENPLSFPSENEQKVFKPMILTSKGVHSSLIPELSHRGYEFFKIILKSPMEIFLFSYGEDIRILDVPFPHFYPS